MKNEAPDLRLEQYSFISRPIDESGKLPLIGLIPKIAKLVAASLDHFLSDWWTKRGEREIEDLPQMKPAAIAERLPALWASDLKDYLGAGDTIPNSGSSGHVP